MEHKLISISDISKNEIMDLFNIASKGNKIFNQYANSLQNKILGSLFFQPSTRTQLSFQSAFVRLGGDYIGFSDINESRSGPPYFEPLDDLGHIISLYCDIAVMRTIEQNKMNDINKSITIPIISAGSGNVEHPTQALTDYFTIYKKFGDISNNNILIIGTPRQRTINSFLIGLNNWDNINIYILCQDGIQVSSYVTKQLTKHSIKYFNSIEELFSSGILNEISILYMDKIFYETEIHDHFVLKESEWTKLPKNMMILHPLPRTKELPKFVDVMPQANYFSQAQNGLYMRSALYLYMFGIC
jgi:aspartate carbamoyltransferase catalytic subunit